jgi:broad specificity phosphatase PhoE
MKTLRVMLSVAMLLSSAAGAIAAGPQVVFMVRHAERAVAAPAPGAATAEKPMTAASDDPPLSVAGHERAVRLAAMLRSADVRHVFTTEYLRTRQTAVPTADARHLEIVAIPAKDPDALLTKIRQATGNVLVVGHSNTIPDLLKALGIKDDITIAEAEYDNLFVVIRPEAGEPSLVRLRY